MHIGEITLSDMMCTCSWLLHFIALPVCVDINSVLVVC